MREENFIYFVVVVGFFIGVVVAIIKAGSAFWFLMYPLISMAFFYFLILVTISFYVDFKQFRKDLFNKEGHERVFEEIEKDIEERENILKNKFAFVIGQDNEAQN